MAYPPWATKGYRRLRPARYSPIEWGCAWHLWLVIWQVTDFQSMPMLYIAFKKAI